MSPFGGGCHSRCGVHGACDLSTHLCDCHDGWSGIDCSVPYQICPDGETLCWNNSQCERIQRPGGFEWIEGEYEYQCSCEYAESVSEFAGRECGDATTVTCHDPLDGDGETSSGDNPRPSYYGTRSFCTNGGKCLSFVSPFREHPGCDCPEEFEGPHCQYLKGTSAATEMERGAVKEEHVVGGAVAVTLGVVFCGVSLMAMLREKRLERGQRKEARARDGVKRLMDDVEEGRTEIDPNGSGEEEVDPAMVSASLGEESLAFAFSMDLEMDGSSSMPSPRSVTSAADLGVRYDGASDMEKFDQEIGDSENEGQRHVWREVEMARGSTSTVASEMVASEMYLDPDGSSTMPPKDEMAASVDVRQITSTTSSGVVVLAMKNKMKRKVVKLARGESGAASSSSSSGTARASEMYLDPDGSSTMPSLKDMVYFRDTSNGRSRKSCFDMLGRVE